MSSFLQLDKCPTQDSSTGIHSCRNARLRALLRVFSHTEIFDHNPAVFALPVYKNYSAEKDYGVSSTHKYRWQCASNTAPVTTGHFEYIVRSESEAPCTPRRVFELRGFAYNICPASRMVKRTSSIVLTLFVRSIPYR